MTDPFAEPAELVRRVYAYVGYRIGPGPEAASPQCHPQTAQLIRKKEGIAVRQQGQQHE